MCATCSKLPSNTSTMLKGDHDIHVINKRWIIYRFSSLYIFIFVIIMRYLAPTLKHNTPHFILCSANWLLGIDRSFQGEICVASYFIDMGMQIWSASLLPHEIWIYLILYNETRKKVNSSISWKLGSPISNVL